MKNIIVLFLLLAACSENKPNTEAKVVNATEITTQLSDTQKQQIATYFRTAWQQGLYSAKFQVYLDSALLIKPDSAYLWQQKAMLLYKARKYSLGKPFLEKAVQYDPKQWLSYSAFMKCLFSKEYEESIEEFLLVKEKYGDSYVMDHTFNFYLGLNYLQLNKFDNAKEFLLKSNAQQFADFPDDPPHEACHYLDWFYLGVAYMELEEYEEGVASFDMALMVYENFADAMYYKAVCLYELERIKEAKEWMENAENNAQNTINEDQVFYEVYPYQRFHKLHTAN